MTANIPVKMGENEYFVFKLTVDSGDDNFDACASSFIVAYCLAPVIQDIFQTIGKNVPTKPLKSFKRTDETNK